MNISLIIPAYNEEVNIQKGVLDRIGNFTKNNNNFSEVLIIDDGSSDKTKQIIKEKYLSQFSKFKLIENQHRGKAYAIITGIKKAKYENIMFSDIDLATPLEESEKLILELEKGYQVVIGSRNNQRTGAPLLRQIMAVGFIFIRNTLICLKGIKDTQCGFKIFNRDIALKIIERLKVFKEDHKIKGSSVSAGFDLEFLFLASKLKIKIKEVPVSWRHVETKNVNFIKDTIETLKDIFKIKIIDLRGGYEKHN